MERRVRVENSELKMEKTFELGMEKVQEKSTKGVTSKLPSLLSNPDDNHTQHNGECRNQQQR